MKLNLGCAKDIQKGWINVDLHYKHPDVINEDITSLSFVSENSVDEIMAKDILEHLPFSKGLECLNIWYKWLKPQGKLFLQTTNWDKFKDSCPNGGWDLKTLNHMLFAGPSWINQEANDCDWHKSIYSAIFLKDFVSKTGYEIISLKEDDVSNGGNLNLKMLLLKP